MVVVVLWVLLLGVVVVTLWRVDLEEDRASLATERVASTEVRNTSATPSVWRYKRQERGG